MVERLLNVLDTFVHAFHYKILTIMIDIGRPDASVLSVFLKDNRQRKPEEKEIDNTKNICNFHFFFICI